MERRRAVFRLHRPHAPGRKAGYKNLAVCFVVIYDQDTAMVQIAPDFRFGPGLFGLFVEPCGEPKLRPFAFFADHSDFATHQFRKLLGDGKA
ncbi:MAG: hypothetical protein WC799_12845 [Desulfobacteraceae bacterium]|jgi:hypothetical protein